MKKQRRNISKAPKKGGIVYEGKAYTSHELYRLAVGYDKGHDRLKALQLFQLIVKHEPSHAHALNSIGACHHNLGRLEEAVTFYEHVIAAKPDYPEALNNLGIIRMERGDMAEAEKLYKRALAAKPDYAKALHNLATIRRYESTDDPDFKRIEAAFYSPALKEDEKARLCFALGKIYDDCKLYDQAFFYYKMGNQLTRQSVPYHTDRVVASVDALIAHFTPEFFKERAKEGNASRQPVFILGMPRSGTTLLASMFSRHPDVGAAGELGILNGHTPQAAIFKNGIPYPQGVKSMTSTQLRTLADQYLGVLAERSGRADGVHIIDKHPLNFIHLGMIQLLFPNARVIHVSRDPMDTCLSNYFQLFSSVYSYSFELKSLAHFYGQYKRLMAHWQKVLPRPPLEVAYEELVSDTEPVLRRALEELGLPWHEACLTPHLGKNHIHTASVYQVRQPVYTSSVHKWKHYRNHLTELSESMEATA